MRSNGQSFYGTRIRRRALLTFGGQAALGVAALALIGCGDDDDDDDDAGGQPTATPTGTAEPTGTSTAAPTATTAPTETPPSTGGAIVPSPTGTDPATVTAGGTVVIPSLVVPELLDPHFQLGGTVWRNNVGDPFLEMIDAQATLRPYLIESWEIQDPTTTLLNVRQGVNFQNREPANGRDVEARDIVYSLRGLKGDLYPDEGAPRRGAFFRVEAIDAVDTQTAKVTFEGPSSVFIPGALGDQRNIVLPEGIREHFGGTNLNAAQPEQHVASGPYIPESYQPGFEYTRNPDYWNAPYPFIERFQSPILADRTTQVTGMLSGQFMWLDETTQQEQDLLRRGSDDIKFIERPPRGFFYHIGLNLRRPGLSDVRLRQALSLVLDRPSLGLVILGNPENWRVPGPLPWTYAEAIPQDELRDRPQYRSPTEEDLTEARRLLDATGISETGLTIRFRAADVRSVHAYPTVAEFWAEQVNQHLEGVEVVIDPQTYSEMLAGIQAFDFDAYAGGWTHEADATLMMNTVYSTDGPRGFTGYSSTKMDGLLQSAFAAVDDPEERRSLLREAQELALVDLPVLPTHHLTGFVAQRPEIKELIWTSGGALKTYSYLGK